ncbi:MAG: sulfite exporter TauE/SafE family protein [Limisphaerales bacterium]
MTYLLPLLVGVAAGFIGGLFGVGGGVVMVPAMIFIMKMETKMAIGTSMAVVIFTAISATAKHATNGAVDWKTALPFIPAAMIGGYLGALTVQHVPADQLKRIFGGFLLVVGLKMLIGK